MSMCFVKWSSVINLDLFWKQSFLISVIILNVVMMNVGEPKKQIYFLFLRHWLQVSKNLTHLNLANIWEKKIIIRPVWLASRFKRAVLRRKSTQILDKLGCFTKIFFVKKWSSLMPRVSPKFIEVNCGIKNISLWPVL